MALPALSSSGVKFRRVLAHFPQELSLAFAYGSGVFRQAGASAGPGEVSAAASPGPGLPLGVPPGRRGPCAFRLPAWRRRSALPGAASGLCGIRGEPPTNSFSKRRVCGAGGPGRAAVGSAAFPGPPGWSLRVTLSLCVGFRWPLSLVSANGASGLIYWWF